MKNNLVKENTIFETTNEKYAFLFGIFMILLVAMTNGETQYINTFFVGLSLIGVLILPVSFSISIIAGTIIYLGYSDIGLENYLPYIQSAHTYQTFIYILFALRIFWSVEKDFFKSIKKSVIILMLYIFLSYLRSSVFIAMREMSMIFVSVWLIHCVCTDSKCYKQFAVAFITFLLTVFLYNFLYSDVVTREADALGRFVGVKDANNFAFYCNLCLVFILFFNVAKKNKVLIGVIVSGCVLTISISGLIVMISLFSIYFLTQRGFKHAFSFLLSVILIAIMLGPITRLLDTMNIPAIDGYIHRLTNITLSLDSGDYNDATTDRTWLWEYYMDKYETLSLRKQVLGSPYANVDVMKQEHVLASHNSWIDMLFNYGIVGIILTLICIAEYIVYYIKIKRTYMAGIIVVFSVHAFFRTISGVVLFFSLFL